MFDIISYIREKILRRPRLVTSIAGEELSEKKTTKLGYFLLYCMFSSMLVSAQWALSIIKDIPKKPTNVPVCIQEIYTTLKGGVRFINEAHGGYGFINESNNCGLTSTQPNFDFRGEYSSLEGPFNQINSYVNTIQNLKSQQQTAESEQRKSEQKYNTSLAEKTAGENSGLYDTNNIQNEIRKSHSEISTVETQITELENKISAIQSQYADRITELDTKITQAKNSHQSAWLLYKFYIALLSLTFAFVVFIVLYKIYLHQKLRNSPFTIIFSVATFAYGLVLLEVSLIFIWDIVPRRLLEIIGNIFEIFTPLVYLVLFVWPAIIIGLFGYAVFKIQKRLYSPENILKRFITDKKCPSCDNAVDFTKPFCPLCAHEIQIHCQHCHELSLKGMPYCSNCGGKLPKKDSISYGGSKVFDDILEKELKAIDTTEYSGVNFIPKDGPSFSSNRENIVKISIYLTGNIGKTSFEANEFGPYLDKVLKYIKNDTVHTVELTRVLGKIRSWVESGGEITFSKKNKHPKP